MAVILTLYLILWSNSVILYVSVSSLDTLHDPDGHVLSPLVDGLMVILYPVISDPPLSDGTVHCIVALLYVEVSFIHVMELGGFGSSKFSYKISCCLVIPYLQR